MNWLMRLLGRMLLSLVTILVCSRIAAAQTPPRYSQYSPATQAAAEPQRPAPYVVSPTQDTTSSWPRRQSAAQSGQTLPVTQNNTSGDVQEASDAEPAEEQPTGITGDEIKKTIAAIEQQDGLEESLKLEQLELARQALKWRETTDQLQQKTKQFQTEVKTAPELLAKAQEELAQTLPEIPDAMPAEASLTSLEQELSDLEGKLDEAREALQEAEANTDSKQRADRQAERARQKDEAKSQLKEAEQELSALKAGEAPDGSARLRQLELETRIATLAARIKFCDAQRAREEALAEWFPLATDLARRQTAHLEKRLEAWQTFVTDFRKAESERQAAEARRIASEAHPAVKTLAESNARLAERRTKLADEMDRVSGYLQSAKETLATLHEDYQKVTAKVEVAGMTPTVGLLLRSRRNRLPDVKVHQERIAYAGVEMQRSQMALLELETQREAMGDINERIEAVVAQLGDVTAQFQPGYLERMVHDLLHQRRTLLDSSLADYRALHDDLNDLDLATRELLEARNEYAAFIDENVLWIRSTGRLGMDEAKQSLQALGAFAQGDRWVAVLRSTDVNLRNHPVATVVLIVAIAALFIFRNINATLENLGRRVTEGESTNLWLTLQALGITLVLAGLWPAVLWGIGWWLTLDRGAPDLSLGLASGLKSLAVTYFALEVFRQLCRPEGLAERHFEWPGQLVSVLHRKLGWLMAIGLPMIFLVTLFDRFDGGAWQDSLGRVAFLVGMVGTAIFMHIVLRPSRDQALPSGLARFRYLTYALGVGFPLVLATLLTLGYVYSAEQLLVRARGMLLLVLGLVLFQATFRRALTVAWQRVRVAGRRVALAADSEEEDAEAAERRAEQTQLQLDRLVRGVSVVVLLAGSCLIWADMFPALQVFDRVELWSTSVQVTQTVTGADGSISTEQIPKIEPITLGDLLLGILAMLVAMSASRSLPGLLEVSVLGRLPIDQGARDAIVIVSRYAVTMVGAIVAFRLVGMTWASVQWLAAAMTVGLGFGLQEIFANLVSGLIILFERPIRIGDLVTVNGTTGKVSRMQIRATTITDFDRRELVVPNKRFITEDVINWTLSDPITRFVIPVGISYDSDPTEAQQLLLRVATRHPLVLREPEPTAVFVNFGDSTLNLELRAFIASRDHFTTVLHEVNVAIERTFREANIEIAFPQQDLHIRSINGLAVGTPPQAPTMPNKAA